MADCANNLHLLPTAAYKPGIPPPAHLSPFVDGTKEGYMPAREREIRTLTGDEVLVSDDESDSEEEVEQAKPEKAAPGKTDADSSDEEEESEE